MKQKEKKMIRVNEYSRLTGLTTQAIHEQINSGALESEMIGGIRHLNYPEKSLIKYKPVNS